MSARARWKELCMDTTGSEELWRFWGEVLGLRFEAHGEAGSLMGDSKRKGIAICPVPESKTVKNRVHIDVYADSIERLTDLGATVVLPAEESGFNWTVMKDPEGNEFCAFLKLQPPDPGYRFFQLVVDAADAREIARWWADVFEAEPRSHDSAEWWGVEGIPDLPFTAITFGQVPEAKTVKNRLHWDLYADVDDMIAAGARVLRERDDEIAWTVMADPEGNEFCVFKPKT